MDKIMIQGARIHNLKNLDIAIPKHKLIVITGISGSGKSSLAFDILFEEGKNQYLKSIGILSGLDNEHRFERIEGIGPTVSVRQNTVRQSNPRSTVGTKTNILNQLALMYASDGKGNNQDYLHLTPGSFLYTTGDGMCVQCQGRGQYYDVNIDKVVSDRTKTLSNVYEDLHVTAGYFRILRKKYGEYFETPFYDIPEDIREEIIYGTFENGKQSYCIERILKTALEKGEDVEEVYDRTICPACHGQRIIDEAREVMLHGKGIGELGLMTISNLYTYLQDIQDEELSQFSRNIRKNLVETLKHLINFRLGHLTLYREMSTLSGGEIQRLFLHLHIESRLNSLIYVFDEPMAGLHPYEKISMIKAVKQLRDLGNTVIVVEHDKEMIKHAEHIIEIGPKAGVEGGEVVFQGNYEEYIKTDTLLSRYIRASDIMEVVVNNDKELSTSKNKQEKSTREVLHRRFEELDKEDSIILHHANANYLKDLTVTFPLHAMVGIAGLSGSGKSSLIEETLLKRIASARKYHDVDNIEGVDKIDGVVTISQEPIGRNSSSTPASYIGIWDKIRDLFAKQPKAMVEGMTAGHFSFHSKGACPDCSGSGYERIYLTSDFSVDKTCKTCHGKRFCKESLTVRYKGKTISEVLELSIAEALDFFKDQKNIVKPLKILAQMGMGYLTLGQPTSSLSGGEAQRVKLAKELGRQTKGNILYVLDEPTTGLSLYDTALLLRLLEQLVGCGNSVIVIEHNIEVLSKCDYIIELGPEGGDLGGEIIAAGTPQQLINNEASKTGRYLHE